MLDEARAKPGELKYGSAGVGSILHTTVELLANETKTKFLHVPYRGEAPAITGMLTGDIDFIAATTGPLTPRIKSRRVPRAGRDRQDALARISRRADGRGAGHSGLRGGVVDRCWPAPANLPKPIVDRLNAELRRAVALPAVKSKLEAMGGDPRADHARGNEGAGCRASTRPGSGSRTEANISIN